ncbi:hypothetical protein Bhyg_15611 [Pseudolycoriella hygida]|uniref:Uncharacterized protein n=1 Tax=Pseudolycoriella hygida TaxID=35572 RepID=A0A9Q0MKK7_9DIPT|nr:hypothetical protein Bhyg_15611 [Pseudolycoriella hygida]
MNKYNLLLFLFILPTISTSRAIKKRRRPYVDQQHPILDQIAQANTWQSPNRIISASYLRNPGTGHVNNAKLMISLIPHSEQRHAVDLAASETLSNSQSAAEYVTRALQMRKNLQDKAPHSSYVKYDIYENEHKQRLHAKPLQRQINQKANTKSDAITRNSKIYEDYRRPDYSDDFGEGEYMYRESRHKLREPYDSYNYGSIKSDVKSLTESGIPKAELMKHIEKSVVQYMKHLESEGHLTKPTTTPRPHTEIKTYYRLPKQNDDDRIKEYTQYASTESELFKPAPTKHYKTFKYPKKGTFTTVSTPYPEESFTTLMTVGPNIDLTFRGKRPKPIDLSALDVGQSWSYGTSTEHYTTAKPKLKFNSQTYEDINAMTYSPGKGLIREEPSHSHEDGCAYASTEIGFYGTNSQDGVANVGASITVGDKHPEASDEATLNRYRKPLHMINGIPVRNAFNLNADTLKPILNGDPEEVTKDNWQPYHPSENRYKQPQRETTSASNLHNQHLPYDSYNPKYNNNPEGQGYQENWHPPSNSHRQRGTIGSDMHSSSSVTSPKKIRNTTTVTIHKNKRKKNRNKRSRKGSKNKNLQTELRPPPAETK